MAADRLKTCAHCGTKAPVEALTCLSCGQGSWLELPTDEVAEPQADEPAAPSEGEQDRPRKGRRNR